MGRKSSNAGAKKKQKRQQRQRATQTCEIFGCDNTWSISCGRCSKDVCSCCAIGCLKVVNDGHEFVMRCAFCKQQNIMPMDRVADILHKSKRYDVVPVAPQCSDCYGCIDSVAARVQLMPCSAGCYSCRGAHLHVYPGLS